MLSVCVWGHATRRAPRNTTLQRHFNEREAAREAKQTADCTACVAFIFSLMLATWGTIAATIHRRAAIVFHIVG